MSSIVCAALKDASLLDTALMVATTRWPLFRNEFLATLSKLLETRGVDLSDCEWNTASELIECIVSRMDSENNDPMKKRRLAREATAIVVSALVSVLWKMGIECRLG